MPTVTALADNPSISVRAPGMPQQLGDTSDGQIIEPMERRNILSESPDGVVHNPDGQIGRQQTPVLSENPDSQAVEPINPRKILGDSAGRDIFDGTILGESLDGKVFNPTGQIGRHVESRQVMPLGGGVGGGMYFPPSVLDRSETVDAKAPHQIAGEGFNGLVEVPAALVEGPEN